MCEKCGITCTVHRHSGGGTVRFDHDCAPGPGHNAAVEPPYEKGPIHIDRGARDAAY